MRAEEENETTHVVSPDEMNDVDVDAYDTPTRRAAINQLNVDDLDAWLEQIRERRLQKVKQLEALAKVKSDEAMLVTWLKFEKTYKTARRALQRLDEQEKKTEAILHKCRLLAMAAQLEVGQEESEDADESVC
jgi:hypothetical protein